MNKVESRRIQDKLHRKYPKKDGWTLQSREGTDKKKPDYVVERRNEENILERVVVSTRPVKKLTPNDLKRLNTYARNMAGGRSHIVGKVFAVPSGSNIDAVPEGFTVVFYEPELASVETPMVEVAVPS